MNYGVIIKIRNENESRACRFRNLRQVSGWFPLAQFYSPKRLHKNAVNKAIALSNKAQPLAGAKDLKQLTNHKNLKDRLARMHLRLDDGISR